MLLEVLTLLSTACLTELASAFLWSLQVHLHILDTDTRTHSFMCSVQEPTSLHPSTHPHRSPSAPTSAAPSATDWARWGGSSGPGAPSPSP